MRLIRPILIFTISLILLSACTYNLKPTHYDTSSWPDPLILTHTKISNKVNYINSAKETLKLYRQIIIDACGRQNKRYTKEIRRELNKYIEIYLKPIIHDTDALTNLETNLELAQLCLLSAVLYYDVEDYYQANYYLLLIKIRYENNPDFFNLTVDPMDTGYTTLGQGVNDLQEKISAQTENLLLKFLRY